MEHLTKQEKIIVALMRGWHLSQTDLEVAKEQVHTLGLHLTSRNLLKQE